MLMDIAVNQFSTLRWNFQQDVVKYASQGINKIGLCRDKVSDFGIDAAIDLLFEMRMGVSSVNWAGGFTGSDGKTFLDSVEDGKQAIRFACHVGADCLVVHSGGNNGHTTRHARRIFAHAIDALLPVAEDFGVRIAIEPIAGAAGKNWSIFNKIEQSVEFVNEYSSENLGLVLDLFHCGLHERSIPLFQANANRVALIQLADRTIGNRRQRRLPGQGSIRIRHWLESMSHAGVNCPVELEVFGECNRSLSYAEKLKSFDDYLKQPQLEALKRRFVSESSQAFKN